VIFVICSPCADRFVNAVASIFNSLVNPFAAGNNNPPNACPSCANASPAAPFNLSYSTAVVFALAAINSCVIPSFASS